MTTWEKQDRIIRDFIYTLFRLDLPFTEGNLINKINGIYMEIDLFKKLINKYGIPKEFRDEELREHT